MKLQIGKEYYIKEDIFATNNKETFDKLELMIFSHSTNRFSEGPRYLFKRNNDSYFSTSNLQQYVFIHKVEYLKFAIKFNNHDDVKYWNLTETILKSQEENPELWI